MSLSAEEIKKELKTYQPSIAQLRSNVRVSMFYILILLAFGVPVWFYSTSTYRASLPSADIDKLARSKININIEIDVIKLYDYVSFTKISSFEEKLFDEIRKKLSYRDPYLQYNYFGYVRPPVKKEIESFLKHSNGSKENFEADIDYSNDEAVNIILVPYTSKIIPTDKKALISEWKGRRILYIKSDDESSLISTIINTLTQTISSPQNHLKLQQIISFAKGEVKKIFTNSVNNKIRLKSQAHYDATFTLIVPYPTRKSAKVPEWDFSSLKLVIEPLIQQISSFIDLKISSQILYGYRIEKIFPSSSPDSVVYSTEDLTHIVNRLERFINSNSNMNFVTYLSSEHFQFTEYISGIKEKKKTNRIVVNNDTGTELASFLVPQFGGFVFVSKHNKSVHGIMQNHDLCSYMMNIFEQHLRKLLGISALKDVKDETIDVDVERISDVTKYGALSSWELSSWLIERSVENIARVQVTLASVEDLLTKVPNMVIRDDVANSIAHSTQLAMLANEIPVVFHSTNHIQGHSSFSTSHNATLSRSLLYSRDSLKAAEYAFFHPSLLELLYFQDDQKLGIYVPLLIPTVIPLVVSVKKIIQYLKGTKKDNESKEKTN